MLRNLKISENNKILFVIHTESAASNANMDIQKGHGNLLLSLS